MEVLASGLWTTLALVAPAVHSPPRVAISPSQSRLQLRMQDGILTRSSKTSFEEYYAQQKIVPDAEFEAWLQTLQKPLPLDVWRQTRAPLSQRAMDALKMLQDGARGRSLSHLGQMPAHQWNICAPASKPFIHLQQLRGALQRQEAASMLPASLLELEAHHSVLDMCAAPGSKTIQMLALLEQATGEELSSTRHRGVVVANDASLDRTISLTHRLTSVNTASPQIAVTSIDARWWPNLEGFRFDRILCDVPCSGDGTLRKRHTNTPDWRLDVAESLHSTQVRLLWQGLHLLQSGGRLVYSTCSFNPIENEAVVAAVLRRLSEHGLRDVVQLEKPQTLHGFHARQGLTSWLTSDGDGAGESMRPPASSEEDWLAPELRKCIRLQPQLDDCGGFFVAVFRRASAAPPSAATDRDVAAMPELEVSGLPEAEKRSGRANRHRTPEDRIGVSDLEELPRSSNEWRTIRDFYQIDESELDGHLLFWAPGRATRREKLYLVSSGAAAFLRDHWQVMARTERGKKRLHGRLHALGVKAFERLKLTNVRSRSAYDCQWRPCQQALPHLTPAFGKRMLDITDEAFFADVLRQRGIQLDILRESKALCGGLAACEAQEGVVEPGGAVLSLRSGGERIVSVVVVLSPGYLAVWAPKEELRGLLTLLEGGEFAPPRMRDNSV